MAGSNDLIWLHGKANVPGNPEKICPGRHVRQNEWQPEWNDMYLPPNGEGDRYDYISDYECIFNYPVSHTGNKQEHRKKLQDAKTRLGGTTMQIRELAHFTNPEAADQIVNDHGFRGGLKKINKDENDDDIIVNLSWWSPIFTEDERKNVREHLGEVIKPFTEEREDDLNALKNQFATSDAFQANPLRYGNHLFQYEINELCDHYSQLIDGEPRYKILGTFGYKQEVMHSVLVCSETDGAGQFECYPDVLFPMEDFYSEAVITRDDFDNWYWRPQATGGGEILRLQAHSQNYPRYRRWEHVAFAFHIPDDWIMVCDSPADHRKVINNYGNILELPKNDNKCA